ncbi:alpha/beta fold hydrolase [Herbaspirillum sp. HC18]|nr:alpha/beta fold hydrolase [Herbaspirillum sp. HC18]
MVNPSLPSQESAAKIGSTLLVLRPQTNADEFQVATPADFCAADKIALFIHGFTANAMYMKPLMEQFAKNGYVALAFNYPCYDGIDRAAKRLRDFLEEFDNLTNSRISSHRIVVVGHSMGGLVARALVGLEGGHKYVRKVFTLGTPHNGTFIDSQLIHYLVSWGESISGLVRGGFSKSSLSAKQLMRADGPEPFLDKLTKTKVPAESVAFHSISGGKNYLTIGSNLLLERVMNLVIQHQLNDANNDGLVCESSSDLSKPEFIDCANGCTHHKNYSDYSILNHSNLCNSQILSLKILSLA